MKVNWDDIGRATEAGVYNIDGVSVSVAFKDIEVWQEYPDAVFNATRVNGLSAKFDYILGSHRK